MPILYTSLNEIKSFDPCFSGWKNILRGQGKTDADDVLFPLSDCLKSNSFSDVCWLLGKREVEIQICVIAARMCADSVNHIKNSYVDNAEEYASNAAFTASNFNDSFSIYKIADAAIDAAAAANAAAIDAIDVIANAENAASIKQQTLNLSFLLQAIQKYEMI